MESLFAFLEDQFEGLRYGHLQLQYTKISVEGAEYISKKSDTRILRANLTSCKIMDRGCLFLSAAQWSNLTSIDLSNNLLTSKSCKFLSQAKWYGLLELSLGGNEIQEAGMLHLSKMNFQGLRSLSLYNNKIIKGLRTLSKGKWAIESFYIYDNKMQALEVLSAILLQLPAMHTLWAKPHTETPHVSDRLNSLLLSRFPVLKSLNMR